MTIDPYKVMEFAQSIPAYLPWILGWFVIARLAYDRLKAWNNPISSTDAAYTMVALAAFAYVVK